MKFTNRVPRSWKDLQNMVAEYLTFAGYDAITPHLIDTARGSVEIDVYVETPYELVKHIIFECKYWNSNVTKEKIHAFRTVVQDSGSEIGILISNLGYQPGAIAAAKYSNVRLETWSSFLEIIEDRCLDRKLIEIKTLTAKIINYCDEYEFRSECLGEDEYVLYKQICASVSAITEECILLRKMDLNELSSFYAKYIIGGSYADKEQYLNHLSEMLTNSLNVLEKLSIKPDKPERYKSILKFIQGGKT